MANANNAAPPAPFASFEEAAAAAAAVGFGLDEFRGLCAAFCRDEGWNESVTDLTIAAEAVVPMCEFEHGRRTDFGYQAAGWDGEAVRVAAERAA